MKSKLYSIDFKTLYFVLNAGEEPQEKVHELLAHMSCNDLIEDILESSNDYINIVDIVNEDEIKA
tara:strand:+ start:131 stop:325 length:195 start_codon:yes stop_codon:yes gene_type:complete